MCVLEKKDERDRQIKIKRDGKGEKHRERERETMMIEKDRGARKKSQKRTSFKKHVNGNRGQTTREEKYKKKHHNFKKTEQKPRVRNKRNARRFFFLFGWGFGLFWVTNFSFAFLCAFGLCFFRARGSKCAIVKGRARCVRKRRKKTLFEISETFGIV